MADVMAERIRSIQRCVGVTFIAGALFLAYSIIAQPSFDDVNRADQVLALLAKQGWTGWMALHAVMILGFALVTVGFAAFAFLLHLRGSSGSASVITVTAVLGGALWIGFFAAELYGYRYLTNLYTIDPSRATELFSTVWFWKLGAMVVAALLTFLAVAFAGATGTKRGVLPVWLGWGGALFAIGGLAIYAFSFLGSTDTGAAINPMQSAGVRYGIGLPLQLWVLGVGAWMMYAFVTGVSMAPPAPPVSRPTAAGAGGRPAAGPGAPPPSVDAPPEAPAVTKRPPGSLPHPALPPDS
jgi:hypothetical protein